MDLIDKVDKALAEFRSPEALEKKIKYLSERAQNNLNSFETVLLFDSRILYPPEFIFGLDDEEMYVVQGVFSETDCMLSSVEFGVEYYGCKNIIVAIKNNEGLDSESLATSIHEKLKSCFGNKVDIISGVLDLQKKEFLVISQRD